MQTETIQQLIESGIPGSRADVDGDGTHFSAVVISGTFAGKTMVQRHQQVYASLGGRMGNEIHALSIEAHTPEEWDRKKDLRVL